MTDPDLLPLAALRAQKTAAFLALAHHAEMPEPDYYVTPSFVTTKDLTFHTHDPDLWHAWLHWLGATIHREYPGSMLRIASATVELADLGPIRVEFSVRKDA